METPDNLKILDLSRKEKRVLTLLRQGKSTPLLIAKETTISRPAIYEILKRLHRRGLVVSSIKNGRKSWLLAKSRDIDSCLYDAKRYLLSLSEGTEEIKGLSDSMVVVHRGSEAIRAQLHSLFKDHRGARLFGIQGNTVGVGWKRVFGEEGLNELNRLIKENQIIVEAILPEGWFEQQFKALGKKWAQDFEGRMAAAHVIPETYFNHAGEVLIFKNNLYLVSMHEEIVIEIKNSEMQKLLLSMFEYVKETSRKVDINEKLRSLIENTKS